MRLLAGIMLAVIPLPLSAQQLVARGREAPHAGTVATTSAVRATPAPIVDGRDLDSVWRTAPVIDGFRVYDPVDDGEPAMRTEARVSYDDRHLYVLVRAFDPHPDSIVSLLSRRDVRTQSDQIKIVIDSYFDRRTGYQFAVNPAGVKRDYYVYNDSNEDESWDAVWEAKTSIDSLGWIAEFKIPFSQLRFSRGQSHTFGIGVFRDVARSNERSSWPLFSRQKFGLSSQLAALSGIDGIASPRRLEVLPYSVQKNITQSHGDSYSHPTQMTLGADLKYGVTSNLTIDATVNPDFGQVEADPSVLNLGAFEQFFQERRPFFLEGSGIFKYDINCNDGQCTGLFYSRRIGRAPQLGWRSEDANAVPGNSTILGAAKLTGRLGNGLSVGVLNAVTGREAVNDTLTLEPRTNYFVGSLQKDFRGGMTGLSAMITSTNRALDSETSQYLRSGAYTGGLEFRHRFGPGNNLNLSLMAAASLVEGEAAAIARTQRSSVHNYQRPDDDIVYDSTRTSLSGTWAQIGLNKVGGGITRFWTGVYRSSPGFEINDVGFMQSANNMGQSNWFALVFNTPRSFYRRFQINFNQWNNWTSDGMHTGSGGNVNFNTTLKSMWFFNAGLGIEAPAYCVLCSRGGPALRKSRGMFTWGGMQSDQRKPIGVSLWVNGGRSDEGRSSQISFDPRLEARFASNIRVSVGPSFMRAISDRQWRDNFGASMSDTTHYTFARLDQKLLALTSRVDYTVSPTLSLQLYASPFATSGKYSNWRELNQPRAKESEALFKPFTLESDPGGFNFKQFRSNTVVRWECRPGSVLFFVWAQGRDQDGVDVGTFSARRDLRNLFNAHPNNTFLVKASYWFSL